MEKIKTTTVYIPLTIDKIKQGCYAFQVDHTLVEKKEDQVVMSKEEFKTIIDKAMDITYSWVFNGNEKEDTINKLKDTYINNLLTPNPCPTK